MSEPDLPVHRLAKWAKDGFPTPPAIEKIFEYAWLAMAAAFVLAVGVTFVTGTNS